MRTLLVIITQRTNLKTSFTAGKGKQRKFTWKSSKCTKGTKWGDLLLVLSYILRITLSARHPNFSISKIRWVILSSTLCKSNPRSGVLADWTCQISHVKESLVADSRILVIEIYYIKILQLRGFSTFSSMFPAANVVK